MERLTGMVPLTVAVQMPLPGVALFARRSAAWRLSLMADPTHPPAGADRNLLFGVLALQMEFIGRDALVAAMHAWALDKARPLGAILVEQGALAPARLGLLDALVDEHLRAHGGDPGRSLAAFPSGDVVRRDLESIADPDVQASLGHFGTTRAGDPEATGSYAPGTGNGAAGLRYRVLRPHAEGGLGVVSVAEDL